MAEAVSAYAPTAQVEGRAAAAAGGGLLPPGRNAALANALLSVFRIQAPELLERYQLQRQAMEAALRREGKPAGAEAGTELALWHGPSSVQALMGIVAR